MVLPDAHTDLARQSADILMILSDGDARCAILQAERFERDESMHGPSGNLRFGHWWTVRMMLCEAVRDVERAAAATARERGY